jgi:hypothetical protein
MAVGAAAVIGLVAGAVPALAASLDFDTQANLVQPSRTAGRMERLRDPRSEPNLVRCCELNGQQTTTFTNKDAYRGKSGKGESRPRVRGPSDAVGGQKSNQAVQIDFCPPQLFGGCPGRRCRPPRSSSGAIDSARLRASSQEARISVSTRWPAWTSTTSHPRRWATRTNIGIRPRMGSRQSIAVGAAPQSWNESSCATAFAGKRPKIPKE